MLPEIRAAFLGMTLMTGVIDTQARQLCCDSIAVHVMAAHAVHLPFQNRVRESFLRFVALHLMASEADLGLRRRLPNSIARRVQVVTIGASYIVAGMGARVPAETDVALVTIQANGIVSFDTACRIRCVMWYRRPLLAPTHAGGVRSARSVARLTLQLSLAKRAARIGRHGVFRMKYGQTGLIVMTGNTGIRAFAAVVRFLAQGRLIAQKHQRSKTNSLRKQSHQNHLPSK